MISFRSCAEIRLPRCYFAVEDLDHPATELFPVHDELPQALWMENRVHRIVGDTGVPFRRTGGSWKTSRTVASLQKLHVPMAIDDNCGIGLLLPGG